ncbi:MAG: biotin transporter BioY [Stappiaceae bacterium]
MTSDRHLVLIALFAALIAALGLVPAFQVPFLGGVPITAQTLGVMLAGVILGPVRGALAVLLLLFGVALGLPLLAGGRGGLGVFQSPSVGFLIGWPIAAFVTGLIMQKMADANVLVSSIVAAAFGGIIVLYAFGVPGLAIMLKTPLWETFIGAMIYVPGDMIKVVLTGLITQTIARGYPSALLTRRS